MMAVILMQACASMHTMPVAQMVMIDAPTLTHGDLRVVDGQGSVIYMQPSAWHDLLCGEEDLSPWIPMYVIAFFTWILAISSLPGPTSFSNHHHHPTH